MNRIKIEHEGGTWQCASSGGCVSEKEKFSEIILERQIPEDHYWFLVVFIYVFFIFKC